MAAFSFRVCHVPFPVHVDECKGRETDHDTEEDAEGNSYNETWNTIRLGIELGTWQTVVSGI